MKRAIIVIIGMFLGVTLYAESALAHTTNVCWRSEADGTVTFYAATYHGGTYNIGGMIIDGQTYHFTSSVTSLPSDITDCQPTPCSLQSWVRWQVVNVSGLGYGSHSFTTTGYSATEAPWQGCYPQVAEFGGCTDSDGDSACDEQDNCPLVANPGQDDSDGDGAGDACDVCPFDADDDADGDGLCGDVDACAGTQLPESVPTVRLGVNRFADTDGDGQFDTRGPNGVGPRRSYTIEDTAGCSCEQIIEELELGNGHSKFGCSISAMDDWVAHVTANGWTAKNLDIRAADEIGACSVNGSSTPPWSAGLVLVALMLAMRRRKRES